MSDTSRLSKCSILLKHFCEYVMKIERSWAEAAARISIGQVLLLLTVTERVRKSLGRSDPVLVVRAAGESWWMSV
ncbi:hypothetical protein JOB18_025762 [Solea senegalensis]|uniref:Uncharacterized protein n=1 Tax=Solea senegalensis TaxID=28829 RepID=A0AAV6RL10_SOLSE|nr:hypothetical protein JOB18_025762 [Solea senegalensis]